MSTGTLFLVPVSLGPAPWPGFLPQQVQQTCAGLQHFVVENAKTARAQLKLLDFPRPLRDTVINELPREENAGALDALLAPALAGHDIGLMSEAGCPAVADPGARLVARAHALGVRVAPLVGPSSILLALMASGLNGQSFTFHGYLPVADGERDSQLRSLEEESRRLGRTQIFIETPYRNERMLDALLRVCRAETRLGVARDLTTADEWIRSQAIAQWRKTARPELARHPALFLLLA